MSISPANSVLVDARNISSLKEHILQQASKPKCLVGFDIETTQRQAHEGIKELLNMKEDFKPGKKVLFDFRRSTITGCSFYFGMSDPNNTYYLNFKHADEENRIPISIMFEILDKIKEANSELIIHNKQYEQVTIKSSFDYDLPKSYCSQQLCVTAYNPDTYNKSKLQNAVTKGINPFFREIENAFHFVERNLNFKQEELVRKFCSKSKGSAFSYEGGIVPSIAYGYGLKSAVKTWFGYSMATYQETLNGKPDMEALTGVEVADYGCDDAFWCYHLFLYILNWLTLNNPKAIETYENVENPLVDILSSITVNGMSVNLEQIHEIRGQKREEIKPYLVEMKQLLREALGDEPPEYNEKLAKYDKWYTQAAHQKYYRNLKHWIKKPDDADTFDVVTSVKCATGNAWFKERFGKENKSPLLVSINHYMAMRYILFVVFKFDFTVAQGKVQSNGEARSKMEPHPILDLYKRIGDIEQGMKLYNTPYIHLTDPETKRMYPQVSSMLATRRMSCQNPNTSWDLVA